MLGLKQKTPTLTVLCTVFLTLVSPRAHAKYLQILHTNDLHAAMKSNGPPHRGELEYGGWARIKYEMDRLESAAKSHGIETIRLDAGDFLEGTAYYFPDNGYHVMKAFQHMGYDAAALGNHDWLMGARGMNQLFSKIPQMTDKPTPILSANVKFIESFKALKKHLIPSTQIVRGGMKVGVFGLSTNEKLYSWIPYSIGSTVSEFGIGPYHDGIETDWKWQQTPHGVFSLAPHQVRKVGRANRMIQNLRKEKNDIVIALTHIGTHDDKILAKESENLDIIIGGHSHEIMDRIHYEKNRKGQEIPIVQTGANGKYIGRVILEVDEVQKPRVLTYDLVEVLANGPEDPVVKADVERAEIALTKLYSKETCLDDVIGVSDVRLVSGSFGPTTFGQFVTDAIRKSAKTDFAVDIGAFNGITQQPSGPITRRMLMEMYPRKFEAHQNEGVYVFTVNVAGWAIKKVLEMGLSAGYYVSFSGLTYRLPTTAEFKSILAAYQKEIGGWQKIKQRVGFDRDSKDVIADIKVILDPKTSDDERAKRTARFPIDLKMNGTPLDVEKSYSLAISETAVRGLYGMVERGSFTIPYLDLTITYGDNWGQRDKQIVGDEPIRHKPDIIDLLTFGTLDPNNWHGIKEDPRVPSYFSFANPRRTKVTMWQAMENHLRDIKRITRISQGSLPFPLNDEELEEGTTHLDPRWGAGANPISISIGDALNDISKGLLRSGH